MVIGTGLNGRKTLMRDAAAVRATNNATPPAFASARLKATARRYSFETLLLSLSICLLELLLLERRLSESLSVTRYALLSGELGPSLLAKSANAFPVILASDQHALREGLEHSSGGKVTGHRMPEQSLCESESLRRPGQQVLGQLASVTHQL